LGPVTDTSKSPGVRFRTAFSSIDHRGCYAFANQPNIACWKLAHLAETLVPLLSDDREQAVTMATEAIVAFPAQYHRWRR
jgi:uncharacterized protein YdiU (UPF0061 family)